MNGLEEGFPAGWRYGVFAFVVGAVLGPIRELLLAPLLGGIWASLIEAAIMAPLLTYGARWAIRYLPGHEGRATRVGMAVLAAAIVLTAEFALMKMFDLTGLTAQRVERGGDEQFVGLLLLGWLVAQPFRVARPAPLLRVRRGPPAPG